MQHVVAMLAPAGASRPDAEATHPHTQERRSAHATDTAQRSAALQLLNARTFAICMGRTRSLIIDHGRMRAFDTALWQEINKAAALASRPAPV